MKPLKLAVGVPSTQEWKAEMAMSLIFLMNRMMAFHHPVYELAGLRLTNKRGSVLPKLRNDIVQEAIADEMTHLLFLDSDMRFPEDTVQKLLDKDADVVAANCPTKVLPSKPTARQKGPEFYGLPVYSYPGVQPRFEKVWRVGTGVMLIRLAALKKVKGPLFEMRYSDTAQDYVGEDWSFCWRLEQAGIDIFVDHQLSLDIGHIGDYQYGHRDVDLPVKGEVA